MARSRAAVRVNQFAGGLNTEANLLNFPDGASFDEENCTLLNNGSRKRRNGFDTDFGTPINTNLVFPGGQKLGKNQFIWKNAGGIAEAQFIVVQIGNYIGIHSLNSSIITNNRVFGYTIPNGNKTLTYGITSIDGVLVIVTGGGSIYSIEYDGTTFSVKTDRLLVRDLFGVESAYTDPEDVQVRPTGIGDYHLYNLRNQTFGRSVPNGDDQANYGTDDPVQLMYRRSGKYPSMADNVNYFKAANPEFVSNRTVERFNPRSMEDTPPPNMAAPLGYFIIDALDRGASRRKAFADNVAKNNGFGWRGTVNLRADRTPGGPTVVAQYAGRVWYGGFSSAVQDGDKRSPKLSSYLLFSQVVKDSSQIYQCYQASDPTSNEDPDLVDTDGGFIKIDGAYGIKALVAADTSLFVFAENGVWRIVGASEDNFSATSYSVSKVNDKGCIAPLSVVYIDGILLYWSDSAIFGIVKGDVGDWKVEDITEDTIKTFYQELGSYEKEQCHAYYDDITSTVRWLYGSSPETREEVGELIFHKKHRVFTKNRIKLPQGVVGPISVSGGQLSDEADVPVTVVGASVTVNSSLVTTASAFNLRASSENFYCILTQLYPTVRYVFGGYNKELSPLDWQNISPIDTPAYLTTGFVTGGDGRYTKDIPYITTHFNILDNSSCFIQSRWDWTGSPDSGQWSNPRQVYRDIKIRPGDTVVSSRNKIRGMGRSVAINFNSEEGKFFHIYGWEHNLEAATDE